MRDMIVLPVEPPVSDTQKVGAGRDMPLLFAYPIPAPYRRTKIFAPYINLWLETTCETWVKKADNHFLQALPFPFYPSSPVIA